MKKNKLHPFRPKRWAVYMVFKDIVNYREWVKAIKKEVVNPRSLYHRFGMKHNYFYTLYFPLTLPDEDRSLPDNIKRMRVVESLAPVHRYIDEDLQFAEYIVPEFNQFFDEENLPTLTYGIVYRFAFKRISISWAISRTIIVGAIIWALVKWPILSTIVTQIQEWIHLI